jgi:Ser/Thr protein kinase RdoA (MazF antagonist)
MTPEEACRHFPAVGGAEACEAVRGGHIHRTWVADGRWIVQRCNTAVFPDLDAVMGNMAALCRTSFPELLPVAADDGSWLWRDPAGGCWRVLPYVAGTVAAERGDAGAVGRGLGEWHRVVAALDPGAFRVTLPGFHDPGRRLAELRRVAPTGECAGELARIDALSRFAVALPGPTRVAHFDAKLDNFLLDARTRQVRALVDLDTVMPGGWLWDVGDLARSATGTAAEDEPDGMAFDADACEAIVEGYLAAAGQVLTGEERAGLRLAPVVVTVEQAVRFLTDHLAGDVYYRVERRGHNLDRCRAQLALAEGMAAR